MGAASVAGKALDDKTNQTLNNTFSAGFDNAWTVNIGSGSQSTQTDKSSSALGLGSVLNNPMVLLALCAVAYMVMSRK